MFVVPRRWFEIVNTRTNEVVARVYGLKKALDTVDQCDNEYGAAVHMYREV